MPDPSVLGIVLAGGAGTRLAPLTDDRAKPAVPFGGVYRLVDFALSNLVNSSIRKICVLTQYKSHSLDRHISVTWRMSDLLGNYVTPVPAQQRLGPHWYTGSADAIFQSMNLINDENPELVVVIGADHVYRMDPRQMIAQHLEHGAGVTVAALPVDRQDAKAFGIVGVGADGRTITTFLEKPADPPPLPDSPGGVVRVDGHLRVQHEGARGRAAPGRRRSRQQARRRREHHPDAGRRRRRPGLRLHDQQGPRLDGTRLRLLARRRHHRRVLRRAHGPAHRRSHVQPVQLPVAHPHPRGEAAARQVRARHRRPGGPGHRQPGQQRRDRLRRPGAGVRAVPRGQGQQLGHDRVQRAAAQHGGRPARGDQEGDHRQARRRPRGGEDRRGQGARPSPRVRGLARRHHRGGQGQDAVVDTCE